MLIEQLHATGAVAKMSLWACPSDGFCCGFPFMRLTHTLKKLSHSVTHVHLPKGSLKKFAHVHTSLTACSSALLALKVSGLLPRRLGAAQRGPCRSRVLSRAESLGWSRVPAWVTALVHANIKGSASLGAWVPPAFGSSSREQPRNSECGGGRWVELRRFLELKAGHREASRSTILTFPMKV